MKDDVEIGLMNPAARQNENQIEAECSGFDHESFKSSVPLFLNFHLTIPPTN